MRKRPLHPTRSQFKPEASQTQAPVTPATEPERRAGGSLTTAHDDFARLAAQLAAIKGRFILSLNDRPEVRELFASFRIEEVPIRYTAAGHKYAVELLISNG